jgi:hypothetical protein
MQKLTLSQSRVSVRRVPLCVPSIIRPDLTAPEGDRMGSQSKRERTFNVGDLCWIAYTFFSAHPYTAQSVHESQSPHDHQAGPPSNPPPTICPSSPSPTNGTTVSPFPIHPTLLSSRLLISRSTASWGRLASETEGCGVCQLRGYGTRQCRRGREGAEWGEVEVGEWWTYYDEAGGCEG